MTHDEMDECYAQYIRGTYLRENAGILCAILRRVAFSRWRRAVLFVAGIDCLGRWFRERCDDALYPDVPVYYWPV